jgi:murein DD-endopeptidase MepM/ murein hydrolase activator NlpD
VRIAQCAGTLALVVAGAAAWPAEAGGAAQAGRMAPGAPGESPATELSEMDRRLGRLEAVLGMDSPGGVPVSLAQLRRREERVAAAARVRSAAAPRGLPVGGGVVTSAFSRARLHPVLGIVKPHRGIDVAGACGVPVRATGAGRVVYVFRNPTFGLGVDVEHPGGWITRSGHMSALSVQAGRMVARGDELGRVGATGLASGCHVHYEVFMRGRWVDPGLLLEDADEEGLGLP